MISLSSVIWLGSSRIHSSGQSKSSKSKARIVLGELPPLSNYGTSPHLTSTHSISSFLFLLYTYATILRLPLLILNRQLSSRFESKNCRDSVSLSSTSNFPSQHYERYGFEHTSSSTICAFGALHFKPCLDILAAPVEAITNWIH